jgi:hypothetical protein
MMFDEGLYLMFLESDNLASYKPSEFQISSPKLFIKHHLRPEPSNLGREKALFHMSPLMRNKPVTKHPVSQSILDVS